MKNLTLGLALLTAIGTFAPVAAQAAPFFTPHAKIVQEINHSYGTQFKVPGQATNQANNTQN